MKIAIFADNFYPELSGLSDSIIVLAKNLAVMGHQVLFFVPQYRQKDFSQINQPMKEIHLGQNIYIHRLFSFAYPAPTNQGRMVIPTGVSSLELKKFQADLVHTQSFFGVGLEALIAARLLKLPLVGTNHTPITEFTHYTPLKSRFFDQLSLNYVAWYYNQCDYITAPDREIITEMQSHGFHGSAQSLSNPIELDRFFPVSPTKKRNLKAKFKLSHRTVLYAGRLAPEKHLDVIIQAIALVKQKMSEINLVISGHGVLESSLRQLVEKEKLEQNVKFFGTVNRQTHQELYQAADLFVLASTAETQSLSLMKAMASGLPVIGVRARALPEYINQKNGFIIDVGDIHALAEKILLLMTNTSLAHRLGQQGMSDVQKFSARQIAQKWQQIYLKVTRQRRGR